jgi:hypothetical protein
MAQSGVEVSAPTVFRVISTIPTTSQHASQTGTGLLDTAADLGRNGAAFAALGEMPVAFFPLTLALRLTLVLMLALLLSVVDRKDGVKLGESTLRDFFILPL